jgi:uncharacterized protein (TIGR02996 family)
MSSMRALVVGDHLIQARDARDDAERLRHLVAAWRLNPAVDLASIIVSLGAKLDRARAKLPGKDKQQRLSKWLAIEKGHDDVLTGWLLAHSFIHDLHRLQDPCMARIARWPRDPRLTDALVAKLEPGRYITLGAWAPLWKALAASRDPRALTSLHAWRARTSLPKRGAQAARVIAALEKDFPTVPELTDRERTLLGKASDEDAGEAELLAAVWASPNDDGPRLVYADFLHERGDPRGELIVLQCQTKLDAKGRGRARSLIADHAMKWLGPLAPAVLENKPIKFERGFLSVCTVHSLWGFDENDARERATRALADHPAWSTLREVRMAKLGKRTRAQLVAHLAKLGVAVKFAV